MTARYRVAGSRIVGAVPDQVLRRLCVIAALSSVGVIAPWAGPAAANAGDSVEGGGPSERTGSALAIGGTSTCPRSDAIWAALETLLPREHLEKNARALASSPPPIQVLDLGIRFRLIAAGLEREYRDDLRDCEYRARVAAVFVALWLAPGYFGQTIPAPVPEATPAPPPLRSSHVAAVELGSTVDVGLSGDSRIAPALTVHLALGPATWSLVMGATVPLPNKVVANGLRITEFRAPADIGVRARLRRGPLGLSSEAGLTVALLTERAPELAVSTARSTVEFGARVAFTLHFGVTARVAPFLTAHVEFVPRPTSLWAVPHGEVGRTPMFWFGATLGASLGL